MKYRVKPVEIEALLFNYTPTGVAALMFFAGDDFQGTNKPRGISTKGVATVAGRTITEGEYLVRRDHDFSVMPREAFERIYEPVPQTPVPEVKVTPATAPTPAKVEAPKAPLIRYANISSAARAAQASGQVTFTWHKPCVRGHNAPRYAKGGTCKQCNLDDTKEFRAKKRRAKKAAKARRPKFPTPAPLWPVPAA